MPEPTPAPLTAAELRRASLDNVVRALRLEPHPEGGHYRRTWAHPEPTGTGAHPDRPRATSILYALSSEVSAWHRVDATELWFAHAGDALELRIAEGSRVETIVLGNDVVRGEQPQAVVPAGAWQSARSLGAWSLVSCAVVPGFTFEGFDLAPADWEPGDPIP